jgi:hypothetical protein
MATRNFLYAHENYRSNRARGKAWRGKPVRAMSFANLPRVCTSDRRKRDRQNREGEGWRHITQVAKRWI